MRQTNTATFEIAVEDTEPPYVVTARGPGLDQPVRASLADRDAWLTTELRNILDIMARENITGGELPPEAIERVGRRLFEVLFGSDIAVAFGAARAMQKDKGLRLRLEIVPPGLSALPWETMHDANGWLSTRGDTPLVRRFPAPDSVLYPSSLKISPPLRILFVGASPANNTPIDIEAIAARLAGEEVLGKLIARKVVSFETLLHSTTDALLDKLAEDFHAIVFVCHGGFDETDGLQRPVIFLEDEDGDMSPLPAKGHLTDWLREKPTRLVLVAACNTAANTDETGVLLRSFAQELCETVPAVIAMQYSVSDLVAPAFVEQYLQLLAAFRPVDVAIAEARQSLILPPYQAGRDVFAPVMYLQTDDGALFRKARNWALYGLMALLPILIVLASIAGYALDQRRKVEAITLSQTLAKRSQDNLPEKLDLALLLSAQAIRSADTIEARSALWAAFEANPAVNAFLYEPSAASQKNPIMKTALAASKDGTLLASAVNRFDGNPGGIQLWDLTTGKPTGQLITEHVARVTSLGFSEDGSTLAAGYEESVFRLWDVAQRTVSGQHASPANSLTGIEAIGFGPAQQIFALHYDRLWNANTGEALGSSPDRIEVMASNAAFSPDGRWIARGGCGTPSHSGCQSGSVVLINTQTGRVFYLSANVDERWRHTTGVNALAFSSDGKILATGDDKGTILLWDVENQWPLMRSFVAPTGSIMGLAFGANDKMLFSGAQNGDILQWLLTNEPPLSTTIAGDDVEDGLVAFIPNSDRLLIATSKLISDVWSSRLIQVEGTIKMTDSQASFPTKGNVTALAVSSDGRIAATGDSWGTITLWRMELPPRQINSIPGSDRGILDVGFTSDNQRLIAAVAGEGVVSWNLATGKVLRKQLGADVGVWGQAALSPDLSTLAVKTPEETITIWNIESEEQISAVPSRSILFSVAFSSDGKFLAAGYQDGKIILWNPSTGESIGSELVGHKNYVTTIAFSSDSSLLMSGSCTEYNPYHCPQGEVRLWALPSRQPLAVHPTHAQGYVGDIAFRSDGKTAALASDDLGVLLFDLHIDSGLERACAVANRNLSEAEWNTYLGSGRPYQCTCPDLPAGEGAPSDSCQRSR